MLKELDSERKLREAERKKRADDIQAAKDRLEQQRLEALQKYYEEHPEELVEDGRRKAHAHGDSDASPDSAYDAHSDLSETYEEDEDENKNRDDYYDFINTRLFKTAFEKWIVSINEFSKSFDNLFKERCVIRRIN